MAHEIATGICPFCRERLSGPMSPCPGCGAPPEATAGAWAATPPQPSTEQPQTHRVQHQAQPRRRTGLVAGGVVALVIIAATASGAGVWAMMSDSSGEMPDQSPPSVQSAESAAPGDGGSRTPAPAEPYETRFDELRAAEAAVLGEEAAATLLTEVRAGDAAKLLGLPTGAWFPQVSSKCAPLRSADIVENTDGEALIGYPDGAAENYPAGIGSQLTLAYHVAMRERFGTSTALVLPQDIGSSNSPPACQGEPIWISLWTGEAFPDADAALAWCDSKHLPDGECGARLYAPNGESDFQLRAN